MAGLRNLIGFSLILLTCSFCHAVVTNISTPKSSRISIAFGEGVGLYSVYNRAYSYNSVSYIKLLGRFGYGGDYQYLYHKGARLSLYGARMLYRPDWDLEAEPYVEVGYGRTQGAPDKASGDASGAYSALGLGFDMIRGPFYSTTIGYRMYQIHTDSRAAGSMKFNTIFLGLNIDLY